MHLVHRLVISSTLLLCGQFIYAMDPVLSAWMEDYEADEGSVVKLQQQSAVLFDKKINKYDIGECLSEYSDICYSAEQVEFQLEIASVIGLLKKYNGYSYSSVDLVESPYFEFALFKAQLDRPFDAFTNYKGQVYRVAAPYPRRFNGCKNRDGTFSSGIHVFECSVFYIKQIYWTKIIALLARGLLDDELASVVLSDARTIITSVKDYSWVLNQFRYILLMGNDSDVEALLQVLAYFVRWGTVWHYNFAADCLTNIFYTVDAVGVESALNIIYQLFNDRNYDVGLFKLLDCFFDNLISKKNNEFYDYSDIENKDIVNEQVKNIVVAYLQAPNGMFPNYTKYYKRIILQKALCHQYFFTVEQREVLLSFIEPLSQLECAVS